MKAPTERLRVFFALWPPAPVASRLAGLGAAACPAGARRMRPETLHLTLAFVGDIDTTRLAALMEAGDRIQWPAFDLLIDRVCRWTHNHIIWAGVSETPPVLESLADGLYVALRERGIELPERPFKPHITLARKSDDFIPPTAPVSVPWSVDGGVLVASERTHEGAHYRVIRQWPGIQVP